MPLILEKAVSLQLIINMLRIMKKYLKRHIDQELEIWAESLREKTLLLRGARQVGKTFAFFIDVYFLITILDNVKKG